jgi:chromosome segregation ATPase
MPLQEQEQVVEEIFESPADERARIWNGILKNKASSDGSTYDKQIRNFLSDDELSVLITLAEYRDLVGAAAGREVEIKYLKERIDELNARNAELNNELYDLRTMTTSLRKELRELKEDKKEDGTD